MPPHNAAWELSNLTGLLQGLQDYNRPTARIGRAGNQRFALAAQSKANNLKGVIGACQYCPPKRRTAAYIGQRRQTGTPVTLDASIRTASAVWRGKSCVLYKYLHARHAPSRNAEMAKRNPIRRLSTRSLRRQKPPMTSCWTTLSKRLPTTARQRRISWPLATT